MKKLISKTRFYGALYAARLGAGQQRYTEIKKARLSSEEARSEKLRVYFWTPVDSPGAGVIVHDMLPTLRDEIDSLGLKWRLETSDRLPDKEVDWLICFKAVPNGDAIVGHPRKVFLICDIKHYLWNRLKEFDFVMVAPARSMAAMIGLGHPHVFFLGESEPIDYLKFGQKNLSTPPAERGNVLMWHGGKWSLPPLLELRPELERFAETRKVELHVISGQEVAREEAWGKLLVRFLPWSKKQLRESAAQARLGLIPAKRSLRLSWLKPASRVRCLYSLGVPTIGDGRAPDVKDFLQEFGGPSATISQAWADRVASLWDDSEELLRLSVAGYATVSGQHSTLHTAQQWIRFLSCATRLRSQSLKIIKTAPPCQD